MAGLQFANAPHSCSSVVSGTILLGSPDKSHSVALLANQLETLLQCFADGHPPTVQVPSVMALADFYHCDVLTLLASLHLLHQHAYDYRMVGLDSPLELVDPLCRFRYKKSLLRQKNERRTA